MHHKCIGLEDSQMQICKQLKLPGLLEIANMSDSGGLPCDLHLCLYQFLTGQQEILLKRYFGKV